MHLQNAMGLLSVLSAPSPPSSGTEDYAASYAAYVNAFSACKDERQQCVQLLRDAAGSIGVGAAAALGVVGGAGVGTAETVYSWVPELNEVGSQIARLRSEYGGGLGRVGDGGSVADVSAVKTCVSDPKDCAVRGVERVVKEFEGVSASVGEAAATVSSGVVFEKAQAVKACVSEPANCATRGVHYLRNKRRRDAKKAQKVSAASQVEAGVRSVEEREAARTLAERRVYENKVAAALAKHKLAALNDASRTEAVARLASARMEERINTAKAKSQASFKKCDASLKSLGSTGSAGEFALKQEAKRAQDLQLKYDYVCAQFDKAFPYCPAAVKQEIAEMPEPVYQSSFDLFGECPSDYDEEEAESYYQNLRRLDAEGTTSKVADVPSFDEVMAKLKNWEEETGETWLA